MKHVLATLLAVSMAQSAHAQTPPAHPGEALNVLERGADPTGRADFAKPFQEMATALPPSGTTVRFPPGTYRIGAPIYVQDNTLVEVDGGAVFPQGTHLNADSDGSVLARQQAGKSFLRVSGGTGNAWSMYLSMVGATSKGGGNYEKGPLYTSATVYDPSSYTHGTGLDAGVVTHDMVGLQSSGSIIKGNMAGRVWGGVFEAAAQPGSDGLLTGQEIDLRNNGASQPENNRFNAKTGTMLVNFGPNQVTNGGLIVNGGGTFYDGWVVLKNAVSRYAFVVRDLSVYPSKTPFSVDPSGHVVAAGLVVAQHTPASSSEACTPGQTADDAKFHYWCATPNHWLRVAGTAF